MRLPWDRINFVLTDEMDRAMIPLLKEEKAKKEKVGRESHRMKVYRTSIMNQMDMTMYMCSMCMCFGANFSDKPSGQS